MAHTGAVLRALSDDLVLADPSEFTSLLRAGIDQIEMTCDRVDLPALKLMLLDVCGTVVQAIHAQQPSTGCSCHATAWDHVRAMTRLDDLDPRIAFLDRMERVLAHAMAEHPVRPAQQAAALMRADPVKPWTLRDLANDTDTHSVRLRREFEEVFGVRPGAYLHLVRVARAVPLFRTFAKVEAIAWEVGYRSKKDFYAALKRWIGLTPTELRALRDDESKWLARELRRRSLRSAGNHGIWPVGVDG